MLAGAPGAMWLHPQSNPQQGFLINPALMNPMDCSADWVCCQGSCLPHTVTPVVGGVVLARLVAALPEAALAEEQDTALAQLWARTWWV